jgi:hypothetical protein
MTNDELLSAYLLTEIHFTDNDGLVWKTASALASSDVVDTVACVIDPACSEAWVITAENPFSNELSERENATRMNSLAADLVAAGLTPRSVRGTSPDGRYSEASFLILSNDASEASDIRYIIDELANKYEQNAYFRIHGNVQELVPGMNAAFAGSRGYALQRVN